jgi:hypothetical protein
MKKIVSFLAVGIALQYSLGTVVGCSSSTEKRTEPAIGKSGTLSMALQTVSDSGKVYRLRNASFFVSTAFFFDTAGGSSGPLEGVPIFADGGIGAGGSVGSGGGVIFPPDGGVEIGGFFGSGGKSSGAGGFFSAGGKGSGAGGFFATGGSSSGPTQIFLSSEEDPTAPLIERFLAPGSYDIELFDGWFIEQVDNLLGTSAAVPATLLSSSFQFFDIQSDQETFIRFDFEVDGRRVTFGNPGRLKIGIGIHETNGDTCGNGVAEGNEECDLFDMRGATCASATMGARPQGTLFCTKDCRFDTTFCQGNGFDGGTGGFGTGGATGTGASAGSVGFPGVDAGAGGVPGKAPGP